MRGGAELRTVARRYAKALLQVALEKKADLHQLGRELSDLAGRISASPELEQALGSPAVGRAGKLKLVEALVEGGKLHRLLHNLLRAMGERDRLAGLKGVAEAYAQALDQHEGIEAAEVLSSTPLNERQQQKLSERLSALTGKRMRLSYRTEAELLGGLVVRIGNRIYDGSIVTQLSKLKERLLAAH